MGLIKTYSPFMKWMHWVQNPSKGSRLLSPAVCFLGCESPDVILPVGSKLTLPHCDAYDEFRRRKG